MRKLVLTGVLFAAAAFPTAAFGGTFSGVVVGRTPGTLAVASKSGTVTTLSTRVRARVGARVRVSGRAVRVVGSARTARIHAVVVRRVGRTTFLAGGRALIVVRGGRSFASAGGSGPAVGSIVDETVTIGGGQLTQGPTQIVGRVASIEIQAQVAAVGPGTITLSVNGQMLTLALPAGIRLPASLVGQTVTLRIKLAEEEPVARPDDENENEQENEDEDDHDDDHEHHDGGGHGGHGDG